MNKQLIYITCLLVSALAAASAVGAQETDASMDLALNDTAMNSTIVDDPEIESDNATVLAEAPESSNNSAINLSLAKQALQNLSTADSSIVAPISQMALPAPALAAGASSIQTAAPQDGSQKIGTVVSDANRSIVNPSESEPLDLSLPTKPIKDVGTIFFVCDLV